MNKALKLVQTLAIESPDLRRIAIYNLGREWLGISDTELKHMPVYRLAVQLAKHVMKGL